MMSKEAIYEEIIQKYMKALAKYDLDGIYLHRKQKFIRLCWDG